MGYFPYCVDADSRRASTLPRNKTHSVVRRYGDAKRQLTVKGLMVKHDVVKDKAMTVREVSSCGKKNEESASDSALLQNSCSVGVRWFRPQGVMDDR